MVFYYFPSNFSKVFSGTLHSHEVSVLVVDFLLFFLTRKETKKPKAIH